jgi:hypothetical protein
MNNLLDPKNDCVFQRLFADAPVLLAALINAVLAPAAPVVEVSVRNPGIDPAELSGKYIVLDLLVEDNMGRQYNLKMQIRRYLLWSARSTYYLARLICGQLSVGDDYADLKPATGTRSKRCPPNAVPSPRVLAHRAFSEPFPSGSSGSPSAGAEPGPPCGHCRSILLRQLL